ELQSIIERAVITARDGQLDLDHALPQTVSTGPAFVSAPAMEGRENRIHTLRELQDLERANLIAALNTAGWRVSGKDGAARLLGINPSTLSSRLKALGIKRPA
ncbi:MAG TPA: helix-turn-helix domain-containing protein, partial [Nitrospirota bacterium]